MRDMQGKEGIIMPFGIEWGYVLLGIHTMNLLWGLAPVLL